MSRDKNTNSNTLISDEVKEYVSLRVQSLKLAAVDNLSTFISKSFGVLLFTLLLTISLLLLTIGLSLWLGEVLQSTPLAFAITGGVTMVAALIIFALRGRLITNSLVRLFSQMFFANRKSSIDQDE
jgi:VIT1/CCC1 family predicted Fe2+/Mn2+ transporter